jgi:hypothetical protein
MKAMLLKKLRLAVGAVMVLVALGAVGVGYQAGGGSGAAQAAPPDKPQNELEALRKENELLKLNLQVVLEKVQAQETELHAVRKDLAAAKAAPPAPPFAYNTVDWASPLTTCNNNALMGALILSDRTFNITPYSALSCQTPASDPLTDAEAAVKALREAKDKEGQRKAAEALDRAMKKLKEQLK